jgi:signal transduction histidine kinase
VRATSSRTADGSLLAGLGRFAVRLTWPFRPALLDAGWAVFSAINLLAIFLFPCWETVPFHLIWISVTVVYGFRTWAPKPTLSVLGVVMAATGAGIGLDVARGSEPVAELTEVPLMAAMFLAMVWHARRKLAAEQESSVVSGENARLLATQRRFLQDASHQLRTPITIALGHAELLARGLTSRQQGHDIQVVLGELNRLRRIAERLLVIAAAEDPEFLYPERVALDSFTMEILRRWRPTANRRWQLGRLDKATIQADKERLGLAIDALLENAVRHTGDGDVIKLSVVAGGTGGSGFSGFSGGSGVLGWPGGSGFSGGSGVPVRMIVSDAGQGIPDEQLRHIFDRFSSGDSGHPRGTGLGLALVRAVARAHGGEVLVRSRPGRGSEFELLLPAVHGSPALPQAGPAGASVSVSTPVSAPASAGVSAGASAGASVRASAGASAGEDAGGGKLARKS